jgi:hypothetical protein
MVIVTIGGNEARSSVCRVMNGRSGVMSGDSRVMIDGSGVKSGDNGVMIGWSEMKLNNLLTLNSAMIARQYQLKWRGLINTTR